MTWLLLPPFLNRATPDCLPATSYVRCATVALGSLPSLDDAIGILTLNFQINDDRNAGVRKVNIDSYDLSLDFTGVSPVVLDQLGRYEVSIQLSKAINWGDRQTLVSWERTSTNTNLNQFTSNQLSNGFTGLSWLATENVRLYFYTDIFVTGSPTANADSKTYLFDLWKNGNTPGVVNPIDDPFADYLNDLVDALFEGIDRVGPRDRSPNGRSEP